MRNRWYVPHLLWGLVAVGGVVVMALAEALLVRIGGGLVGVALAGLIGSDLWDRRQAARRGLTLDQWLGRDPPPYRNMPRDQ